jgi:probable HAF family extracellular repeat protein
MTLPRQPLPIVLLVIVTVLCGVASALFASGESAGTRETYAITDLGIQASLASISERGQIVGTALFAPNSRAHAFVWENGLFTDLGVLPDGTWSYAADVNNRGQAVGGSNADGLFKPFHPVTYNADGSIVNLGQFGRPGGGQAGGINDAGDVVGAVSFLDDETTRAFVYRKGAMYELELPDGYEQGVASKINNAGDIVGYMWAGRDSSWSHAFLRKKDETTLDLGTLGGAASFANDLNNMGEVVGYFWLGNAFVSHRAFLYRHGIMTDLGSLGGSSQAYGINDRGDIVGESSLCPDCRGAHAFLDRDGLMIDLNDVFSPESGWVLTQAADINDAGQIVGAGYKDGESRGFLLTPSRGNAAAPVSDGR